MEYVTLELLNTNYDLLTASCSLFLLVLTSVPMIQLTWE